MVVGPLQDADRRAMCGSLRAALERRTVTTVICEGDGLTDPDLGTVDLLARLRLVARQFGHELQIEGASDELRGLVALTGLDEVLLLERSGGEPGRQAEQREEPRGVEEGVQPDDRAV